MSPSLRQYRINCFAEGLLFHMAWTMAVVFHIKTVGLNPFWVVMMGTIYEIAILTFEVPTGVVADLKSRRLSVLFGWAIIGLGFLTQGLWPVLGFVIAAQVLIGIGETFTSGAHAAWIADELIAEKSEVSASHAFMMGEQSALVGRLVGTWIAVLFARDSLSLVMIASGVGFVFFAALAAFLMKERGFHRSQSERRFWASFAEGWKLARGSKQLGLVMLVMVVVGFASEGYDRLHNQRVLDEFTLPSLGWLGEDAWWSIFASISIVGGISIANYVRKRVQIDEPGKLEQVLAVLIVTLGLCVIGFALTNSFWVMVAFLAVGRSVRRSLSPLMNAWTNRYASPENRATILSFSAQAHSFGEIGGGPLVGQIATLVNSKIAIAVSGGLFLPAAAILARSLGRKSDPEPATEP